MSTIFWGLILSLIIITKWNTETDDYRNSNSRNLVNLLALVNSSGMEISVTGTLATIKSTRSLNCTRFLALRGFAPICAFLLTFVGIIWER